VDVTIIMTNIRTTGCQVVDRCYVMSPFHSTNFREHLIVISTY